MGKWQNNLVFITLLASSLSLDASQIYYDDFQDQNINGLSSPWAIHEGSELSYTSEGKLNIVHGNAMDRILATTNSSMSDGEVTATFEWADGPPDTGYNDVGLVLRANESIDSYYVCRLRAGSTGSARVVIERRLNGVTEKFTNILLGTPITEGASFNMKCAVAGDQIKAKIWSSLAAEPSTWTATVTDSNSQLIDGKYGFRSSAGSGFSGPGSITMDNFSASECDLIGSGCGGIVSPRIDMYAIPSEGIPANCATGYYSVLMYCSGDCSADDARVRFCARN